MNRCFGWFHSVAVARTFFCFLPNQVKKLTQKSNCSKLPKCSRDQKSIDWLIDFRKNLLRLHLQFWLHVVSNHTNQKKKCYYNLFCSFSVHENEQTSKERTIVSAKLKWDKTRVQQAANVNWTTTNATHDIKLMTEKK